MNNISSQSSRLNDESDFLSLRDIFTVLFKHQREIIGIFLFFTILSLIIPMKMAPVYQAESSLMVKIGREHMYNAEVGDQASRTGFDLHALIDPEIEILASRDLSQKVVEELGVKSLYPKILEKDNLTISPVEAALRLLQGKLTVSQSGESNVLRVAFQHGNPQSAAQVVNLLSEFWKEKHLSIFSNPQTSFLEEQVQTFREKLEQSETRLQEFKREHRVSSLVDQRKILLDQQQKLDSRLKFNEDQIVGLGSKIYSLGRQLNVVPQNVQISTANGQKQRRMGATENELLALQRKEQQLLGKYHSSSRMVTNIREEIALIQNVIRAQEAHLKDQVIFGRNPVYQDLQLARLNAKSELSSLKTQQGVISKHVKELDSQILRLNGLEKQLDSLQREVTKDQENVKMYVGKVERAHVSTEMDKRQLANVSVIQAAAVPVQPIKPKKSLILYLGVTLGLLSGIAWAFLAEFFQGGYTRSEQASFEQGIPVLVSINYKS